MRAPGAKPAIALVLLGVFLVAIFLIDQTRTGPATRLTQCNLALARADQPPAEVLVIGSSRSGVALDPVALQDILSRETGAPRTVERMANGNMTIRLSDALLDTYLARRGAPDTVVIEATFMTSRTIRRMQQIAEGRAPEPYLLGRDLNVMTFGQLMRQPAVAMPFTEAEGTAALWRTRVRSVMLRAGALVYQFLKAPLERLAFEKCDRTDITREETWPPDFSFAYEEGEITQDLPDLIRDLRTEIEVLSGGRALSEWQLAQPKGRSYPYDFERDYRQGEMIYLARMVQAAEAQGSRVIVVPLPLYSFEIDPADLEYLAATLPESVEILDLYGQIGTDFGTFWYDDAHVVKYPAGLMTTALMARHLLTGQTVDRQ